MTVAVSSEERDRAGTWERSKVSLRGAAPATDLCGAGPESYDQNGDTANSSARAAESPSVLCDCVWCSAALSETIAVSTSPQLGRLGSDCNGRSVRLNPPKHVG
jgi:hypothetical protein